MRDATELSHHGKVVVFVMYHCAELFADQQIVMQQQLSESGMDLAKAVIDSGFEPTMEEVASCISYLVEEGIAEAAE